MASLIRARAVWQGRLLAAIAGTVLVLVLALTFALGWLTSAVREGVVAAVEAAPRGDRQTVLSVPATDDPTRQAAGVEAVLRAEFGDSLHVDRAVATAAGGTSSWTLAVDPDAFAPWTIAFTSASLDRLAVSVRDVPDLAPEGASTSGGLAATLDDTTPEVLAVASVAPVPLVLTAIGGLIAVLQLARLLGRARAGEASLLRARGMDVSTARRHALAESAVVVAGGSLIGWLAGAGIVSATGTTFGSALRATWPVPVAALLVLSLVAALVQTRAAAPSTAPDRARAAVTGVAAGLVVVAAAVFLWQLASVQGDAAALTASPWSLVVVALAPALGLAAVAMIALVALGPVAAVFARASARRRTLSPALPARMVARHLAAYGVVVALFALASGGSALAGTAISTWGVAAADTAVLGTGADVRAGLGASADASAAVSTITAARGVDAAAAVLTDSADAGGAPFDVVAVPEASAAALLRPLPAAGVDPTALAAAISGDPVGAPLGEATAVRFVYGVEAGGGGEHPSIPDADQLVGEAWFVDTHGTPFGTPLAVVVDPDASSRTEYERWPGVEGSPLDQAWSRGTLTATATLPQGSTGWRLVGLTLGFGGPVGSATPTITPQDVVVDGGTAPAWPTTAPATLTDQNPSVTLAFSELPGAVPVVVTTALAHALALEEGGTFEIALDRTGRRIPARIADIVRAVPGTSRGAAALVPLDQATIAMLAASGSAVPPTEVWATGPGARSAVAQALPGSAVTAAGDAGAFTRALVTPWWAAAVATALLAGVALTAAALGMAQQRAVDVFVLRAHGWTAARQARSRTGELLTVAVGAVIAGAALGFGLSALAVPALTRAAVAGVPDALAGDVVPGILPLVVAALIALASVAVASGWVARLIARQSLAGRVRDAA